MVHLKKFHCKNHTKKFVSNNFQHRQCIPNVENRSGRPEKTNGRCPVAGERRSLFGFPSYQRNFGENLSMCRISVGGRVGFLREK